MIPRYDPDYDDMTMHDHGEWVKYNDHITALPKWISVKDRLPEDIDVLMVVCGTVIQGSSRRDSFYINDVWPLDKGDVTYWMPLPEPPEEDTDGK